MYKIIKTKNAKKATYDYEYVYRFDILMTDLPDYLTAIQGKDLICNNTLQAVLDQPVIHNCYYILAIGRNGKYYIRRVSMHPKTAANLRKGDKKYGFGAIMREIC